MARYAFLIHTCQCFSVFGSRQHMSPLADAFIQCFVFIHVINKKAEVQHLAQGGLQVDIGVSNPELYGWESP